MRSPSGPGARPWVLVAPGFHHHGGMEKANLALAEYLADRGGPVHLVGHTVEPELARKPEVRVHRVPRPAGSFLLGERRLDRQGRAVARAAGPAARVLVNGGNCDWDDVNWVHFVHHALSPTHPGAPLWFQAKSRILSAVARRQERERITKAQVVLSNSELTRRHLITHLGVAPGRIHTVYLGADPTWGVPSVEERAAARAWLGVPDVQPLVVFVGALGHDARKGFDTLLLAWKRLCALPSWDAALIAAGGGRGLERWKAAVNRQALGKRVHFLGFTQRVPELLAAADLLVSPVRYEAYGLNAQEALCRGVPALVSGCAGIAERYDAGLEDLILPDAEDDAGLAERLLRWREGVDEWKARVRPLGARLRAHTWRHMAHEIVSLVEGGAAPEPEAAVEPGPSAPPRTDQAL